MSISCCILTRWPMATGQALPVLQHLECTVQRRSSLLLPPLRGVLRLGVLPPFLKSEREVGLLLTPPSASIACLLQGIFHPIYTSNHQSAPSSCAMQCCSAMGLVVQVLKTNSVSSDLSHHFHRALTPRTTVLSLWAQCGRTGYYGNHASHPWS